MRYLIASILLLAAPAQAQSLNPNIQKCNRVEQDYGSWALNLRRLLDRNSSDRGGRVDASLIIDVNFALASARDFVHENIQLVQRAGAWGGEPSVRACMDITAIARREIEQYTAHLIRDIDPLDKRSREDFRADLRWRLDQASSEIRGY